MDMIIYYKVSTLFFCQFFILILYEISISFADVHCPKVIQWRFNQIILSYSKIKDIQDSRTKTNIGRTNGFGSTNQNRGKFYHYFLCFPFVARQSHSLIFIILHFCKVRIFWWSLGDITNQVKNLLILRRDLWSTVCSIYPNLDSRADLRKLDSFLKMRVKIENIFLQHPTKSAFNLPTLVKPNKFINLNDNTFR